MDKLLKRNSIFNVSNSQYKLCLHFNYFWVLFSITEAIEVLSAD